MGSDRSIGARWLLFSGVLSGMGCVAADPGAMAVSDFGPRALPAMIGGDLTLEGTGFSPRRVIDHRTGEVTVLDDEFLLVLDGRPFPALRRDDGGLFARVGGFSLDGADHRFVGGFLRSPTGAQAELPAELELVAAGAPAIAAIEPATGPPVGGITVTIRGEGFHAPLEAWIGAAQLDDVEVDDGTALHGLLPRGTSGQSVDVRVVDGTSLDYAIRVDGFTFSDLAAAN